MGLLRRRPPHRASRPAACSGHRVPRHVQRTTGPAAQWLTAEDIQVCADNFAASGFFGPLSWYRNIDRNFETGKDLAPARVSMPSFFIAGDKDGVVAFNPAGVEAMKALLPDLRGVAMLPGIGHWTQQEDPEGFNQALLGFLGSLS